MSDNIPCAVSVAERLHDREPEGAAYWKRATDDIVETIMSWGQYPKDGRATVKVAELVGDDFEYRSFNELWMQSNPEVLWSEMRRIKDAAEVLIRERIEARGYSWIVANLADDMARNAEADRWEDE
jgi:hypothetical protein